ncbi:MAG: hypothetical protein J5X21_12230 [Candidatus Accumulibacter sp.]|nr:hypothetical protein [Candidatus Accumulibacter conexus]
MACHGGVAGDKRGVLVDRFHNDADCRVFLKLPVPDPQTVQRPAEGLLGLLGGRK